MLPVVSQGERDQIAESLEILATNIGNLVASYKQVAGVPRNASWDGSQFLLDALHCTSWLRTFTRNRARMAGKGCQKQQKEGPTTVEAPRGHFQSMPIVAIPG